MERTREAAIAVVVADQRRSYPDMTAEEAIAHARSTVDVNDLDENDETWAYRLILGERDRSPTPIAYYDEMIDQEVK